MLEESGRLQDRVREALSQTEGPGPPGSGDRLESSAFLPIPFTLPLDHRGPDVRLQVFYPKRRRSGAGHRRRISLFLHLDRIEDVKADVVMDASGLGVFFRVVRPEARARLEANFSNLFERLTGIFENVSLAAALDRTPERPKGASAWETPAGDRMIDVSI